MGEVGSYEAKTRLSQLLKRVTKGERITITKHGVPIATLVPAVPRKIPDLKEVITKLREFRHHHIIIP